jgi:hypothetical protein
MTWWLSDRANGRGQSLSSAAQPREVFLGGGGEGGHMALTIVPWINSAPPFFLGLGPCLFFFFFLVGSLHSRYGQFLYGILVYYL